MGSRTERMMAIVMGLIMVSSLVGFAAMSIVAPPQEQQSVQLPTVSKEPLSNDMRIYALQTGHVLVEHFYEENCTNCLFLNQMLEIFSRRFSGYMVLVEAEVPGNETKFEAIGKSGRITELDYNMTEESFFETFCEITIKKPTECLMQDILGEEQAAEQTTPKTTEELLAQM